MPNPVLDQMKVAAGMRIISADEVRNAVNKAVEDAKKYREPVAQQAEALSGGHFEATLANSVVGMDDVSHDRPAPVSEQEPEQDRSRQEEASADGPDF